MKLGKKSLLIIAFGLFAIVLFGLWSVYSQQLTRKTELAGNLDTARLKLNGLNNEPLTHRQDELEWHLEQVGAQSAAAREMLSQPIGSIAVSDHLFEIAAANSVNITALSSSGLAEAEMAGLVLPLLPLSITATGDMADLAGFITRLSNDYPTSLISTAGMNIPETGEAASVDIEMAIFSYRGDDDG